MKIGTSVTTQAMRVRDVGQAVIAPHSLKLEASMGRTLSMASSLSTRGRPSAGLKDGGAVGEDRGFFPFSACFGAMAVKRAEHNQIGRTERNQIGRTE